MTFENPQALYILPVLLLLMTLIWFWRGMRTVPSSLILRLLAVSLIVVAIANPTQGQQIRTEGPLVILADQSDSLTPAGQQTLRTAANNLAATVAADDTMVTDPAVLWFGGSTITPGDWSSDQLLEPTDEMRDAYAPEASDLATALRTARSLLTSNENTAIAGPGRIILLSDGLETTGDALAEARLAAELGLTVDVLPMTNPPTPEISVGLVDAPRTLRVGEEYTVQIVVNNSVPDGQAGATDATLRLWDGSELLGEQQVSLAPGSNQFTFDTRALNTGIVRLRAEIDGQPDTYPQNNQAGETAVVAPPPRILIVEGRSAHGQTISAALWSAGIESEVITADLMPTRLSPLTGFDGMLLVDVNAQTLSFDQMATVQEFVRSEGRGLVVIGGNTSFGLGAYENTPLERALPVDMEAPPRPERADVALLLIIDRSASMGSALGVSKFDMAKEAAILSTESLQDEDTIGVLAFDTGQQWTVPFQSIGQGANLKGIQDSIATLPLGGGTDIYAALEVGLTDLEQQSARVRHIVVLTDGRSESDAIAYRQLADRAQAQDITISTIAIGFDADTELLDDLAQWGGGRYYFTDEPEDIPLLTLQESEIARSDPSVEGSFNAALSEVHPLVRGFAPAQLPTLEGYVATTPKETAEVVLVSQEGDPILASWQYGLGRAVAWTSSAADPWANSWLNWEDYGRFWSQLVRYTLPEVNNGPMQLRLEPQPDGARLVATVLQPSGEPLDLANAVAQVTLPNGTDRTFNLRQIAPGQYAQDLLLPGPGPYGIVAVAERDGEQFRTETGYVQHVAAEYQPSTVLDNQLQGEALLTEIAQITGGSVLTPDSALVVEPTNTVEEEPFNPWTQPWTWLISVALLLWVLEIAVRRGLFTRDK